MSCSEEVCVEGQKAEVESFSQCSTTPFHYFFHIWSPCLLLLFLSLESSLGLSPAWQSVYFLFWFCQFCEKSINLLEFLEEPTLVFLSFLHWFFLASPLNSGLQLFFFPQPVGLREIAFFFENAINFTLETDLPVPSKFGVLYSVFVQFIVYFVVFLKLHLSHIDYVLFNRGDRLLLPVFMLLMSSLLPLFFCIHRTLLYTVKPVWIYWDMLSDPWYDLAWWLDTAH